MNKTLVIILSETRASELTFENFKKNSKQPWPLARAPGDYWRGLPCND